MANEQLIDEIVSKEALKQIADLTKGLQDNNKALQDNLVNVNAFNSQIAQAKGIGEFNKKLKENYDIQDKIQSQQAKADALNQAKLKRIAEIEARETAAAQKKAQQDANAIANAQKLREEQAKQANEVTALGLATNKNTKSTNENTASKKQLRIAELQAKEATRQSNLELKAQIKEMNSAKGSLEQRQLALARLQKTLSQLNVEERNSAYGQRLSKTIPLLNTQVLDLEQSIGKSQRKVGNYPFQGVVEGAGKAFSAVRFLANILPGVGVAGLIGFAAEPIINYVKQLDIFKVKLNQVVETRKMLSAVNLQGAQDAQVEIVHLKTLYDTAKNVNLSDEQRYNSAKKLQELYPKTFQNYTIEQIELGKVDDAYLKLTQSILATARARASEQKIAENTSRQLSNEEKIIDLRRQRIDAGKELQKVESSFTAGNAGASFTGQTAVNNELKLGLAKSKVFQLDKQIYDLTTDTNILTDRNLALTKNIVTQQQKGAEIAEATNTKIKKDRVKEEPINYGTTLQDIIKQSEAIFKNEQESYTKRLGALDMFIQNSIILAEKDEFAITAIKYKGEKERAKIIEQANKDALKAFTEQEQAEMQAIKDSQNARLEIIEQNRSQLSLELSQEYAKGIMSRKSYEEELEKINRTASLKSIQIQFETIDKIIAIQKEDLKFGIGSQKEISDNELKASNLRIKYSQLEADAKIREAERVKAKKDEIEKKITELAFASFDLAVKIGDSIFDNRKNKLQDEINLNEKKKQQDIENVNDSVLSESEKADQIAIINARAEANQRVLEQRQKEQDIKKAKFDKQMAILRLTAETAIKVAEYGFFTPLGLLAASLGAVAIATILATPIPKFEKGGTVAKDGIIMTGEKGTELRINPDGSQELTDSSANLSYAKAGTKIIPNHDLKRMLAKPDANHFAGGQQIDISALVSEQRNTTKVLKKAFGEQSVNSTVLTEKGLNKQRVKLNKLNNHIKRNFG